MIFQIKHDLLQLTHILTLFGIMLHKTLIILAFCFTYYMSVERNILLLVNAKLLLFIEVPKS